MTVPEAIANAQYLLALNDPYKIAEFLLQLEHKAHLEGIQNLSAALTTNTEKEPVK